ncbi:hypothetical protein KI387_017448 [Taxus chinensis]|uniref:Uncharacterized protein n=1 Tax=Taxus chinensis TaxID=29808 RepID=A0AA38GFV4_TAXCH|nr:hypothetical protein KI387_017448 [Taxus chinensis]
MSLRKENKSFCTPNGWRLATVEEAKNGLEAIKEPGFLNKWDRVRLLDGWILGPGYDLQMGKDLQIGNDFRGCLGYMLLITINPGEHLSSGSAYEDVHLSDFGREVALFLCVDDWNYEVVYWLLNSWSNSNIMDLADVRGGSLKIQRCC